MIEVERQRADIAVHRPIPPTADEAGVNLLAAFSEIADDTGRETLRPDQSS